MTTSVIFPRFSSAFSLLLLLNHLPFFKFNIPHSFGRMWSDVEWSRISHYLQVFSTAASANTNTQPLTALIRTTILISTKTCLFGPAKLWQSEGELCKHIFRILWTHTLCLSCIIAHFDPNLMTENISKVVGSSSDLWELCTGSSTAWTHSGMRFQPHHYHRDGASQ